MPVVKCTDETSPLYGFAIIEVDWQKWDEFSGHCHGEPYIWDGKCTNLGEFPPIWFDFEKKQPTNGCDCSGYVQGLLRFASNAENCPTGSADIAAWCKEIGLKESAAADLGNSDGLLRLAIHFPDALDSTGHIWFVICRTGQPAHTEESCGGRGPCQRPWNVRLESGHTLNELASVVYCVCVLP